MQVVLKKSLEFFGQERNVCFPACLVLFLNKISRKLKEDKYFKNLNSVLFPWISSLKMLVAKEMTQILNRCTFELLWKQK